MVKIADEKIPNTAPIALRDSVAKIDVRSLRTPLHTILVGIERCQLLSVLSQWQFEFAVHCEALAMVDFLTFETTSDFLPIVPLVLVERFDYQNYPSNLS